MPQVRELAALRHQLGDLEWKAMTMPGYGQAVIQQQIGRAREMIANLEGAQARRMKFSAFRQLSASLITLKSASGDARRPLRLDRRPRGREADGDYPRLRA
jgi:hypothetical protein